MNVKKLVATFAFMVLSAGMIWAQDLPDVNVENMDGETVSIRDVSLTPQTFIVDASGNIVYSHSGYTPGSEYGLYDKLMEISE